MTVLRVDTIAGTGTTFGPLLDGNLEFNSQNYIVLPKGSSNQQGVLRTTEDVIGVGGTYYDNLVLAMPFNEATGLRDVSSRNRNPGAYGNVAISTAQSKYYGSSAYFDGTGDYLQVSGIGSDFYLNEAFTIEMWAYVNAYDTGGSMLIHQQNGTGVGGFEFWINTSGVIRLNRNQSDGIVVSSSGAVNPIGSWNHFVATWDKSNAYIFTNGSLVASASTSIGPDNVSGPIRIGNWAGNSNYDLNGYIQDLRIYKGIAKYTANFTPPERIAETGVGFKTGALRYNTDSNKPELYDGNQWTELQISNVGLGTDGDTGPGARGLFGGGRNPGYINNIEYINISSTGNSIDFGDLSTLRAYISSCSSSTRGVFGGGSVPGDVNIIEYVTISSIGDAINFGDLSGTRNSLSACASSTRGLFAGGRTSPTQINNIEYITISSTGDAQDFGDLFGTTFRFGAAASSTRGVWAGGFSPTSPATINVIQYVTISTLGDTQDFGDLTTSNSETTGLSNSTRGVFGGGTPGPINTIEYITISSLGNSTNFGDLTLARSYGAGMSSSTRGVFAGGSTNNVIDYITISTQGDAVDFGDASTTIGFLAGCSNAHGGL